MLHMNMFHVKILADSHFLEDTENIFFKSGTQLNRLYCPGSEQNIILSFPVLRMLISRV